MRPGLGSIFLWAALVYNNIAAEIGAVVPDFGRFPAPAEPPEQLPRLAVSVAVACEGFAFQVFLAQSGQKPRS